MAYTENCIPEEAFPPRAGLTVIRTNNPNHGLTEDETQDRLEFIRCYLSKDFEVLMMIPRPDYQDDFFIPDADVTRNTYSAYNTYDFQNQRPRFDKYRYAIRKIMGHIQDLAVMHSSISNPVDRAEVKKRYENYLDFHFRDPLAELIVEHQNTQRYDSQRRLKQKIVELKRRITEARKIWARYAPPENWDR